MGTLYTTVGLSVAALITLIPKVGQALLQTSLPAAQVTTLLFARPGCLPSPSVPRPSADQGQQRTACCSIRNHPGRILCLQASLQACCTPILPALAVSPLLVQPARPCANSVLRYCPTAVSLDGMHGAQRSLIDAASRMGRPHPCRMVTANHLWKTGMSTSWYLF